MKWIHGGSPNHGILLQIADRSSRHLMVSIVLNFVKRTASFEVDELALALHLNVAV
jgi:hypothetical protein